MNSCEHDTYYTPESYIRGIVGINIPDAVVDRILLDREISKDTPISEMSIKEKELLKADVYMACADLPSTSMTIEDADGNWRHKESGGLISPSDKNRWISIANRIYAKYGEATTNSTGLKIRSFGMRVWRKVNGYK